MYDRLKEQKDKKQLEYEETHKLSKQFLPIITFQYHLLIIRHSCCFIENLIRGLDDDEVDFLDIIDKARSDAERRQQLEENNELLEFRQRVATLQENAIEQVK